MAANDPPGNLAAQLSTIASALGDLTRRITALAEQQAASGDDGASGELFEVERTLQHASRRLARLVERS